MERGDDPCEVRKINQRCAHISNKWKGVKPENFGEELVNEYTTYANVCSPLQGFNWFQIARFFDCESGLVFICFLTSSVHITPVLHPCWIVITTDELHGSWISTRDWI